jgi:hypothetical protein
MKLIRSRLNGKFGIIFHSGRSARDSPSVKTLRRVETKFLHFK